MASGGGYPQLKTKTWLSRAEQDRIGSPSKDELKRLRWATQGSTIHVISNCEGIDDWDLGSTTNFNCISSATARCGSASLSLVNTTTTAGDYVELDEAHRPQGEDWTEFGWVCMFVHDTTTLRTAAANYTIQLRNAGVWGNEIAMLINTTASMWEYQCIDISGEDRNNVDGFRFVHRRGANAGAVCLVDYIIATDLITGTGAATEVGAGPVIGPVRTFPILTGSTIVPGDAVNFEAIGVDTGAAGDIAILGIACQTIGDPATGWVASDTSLREVLVATEGSVVLLHGDDTGAVIGGGLKLGTNTVIKSAGAGTADGEQGFAKALETSTGATIKNGHQFCQIIAATLEN